MASNEAELTNTVGSVVTTRIKALPWAFKQGMRFVFAWLKDEPPLHEAALRYARAYARPRTPETVLARLDEFAREKRFLMNVGDRKAPLLEQVVRDIGPKAQILELGSFVGYSAILMSRHLSDGGHIVSVDASAAAWRVSREMAELAGVDKRVSFIHSKSAQYIDTCSEKFDVVFLDHWKGLYLQDVRALLERDLLKANAVIVADNVGPLFGKNPYVGWMHGRKDFATQYVKGHIEYQDIEDGVLISRRIAN